MGLAANKRGGGAMIMSKRIFWGIGIVIVGVLLLAANFGYIRPFSVWGLWPVFILVPAAKFALQGVDIDVDVATGKTRHSTRFRPSIGYRLIALWVVVGAAAELLNNVHLFPYDWGDIAYWTLPLLLVGIGLALMLRPHDRMWRWSQSEKVRNAASGTSVLVGDLRFGSRPWVFKSPMLISLGIAGDVDVDLTTAQFSPGDNYLALKAWAGEFTVRVPDNIEVVVEAHCSAGQLRVFDEERDGVSCDLKVTRPARVAASGYASAAGDGVYCCEPNDTEPVRLFIGASLTFGDVRIR